METNKAFALGIDFGLARYGIAIADLEIGFIYPLKILPATHGFVASFNLDKFISLHKVNYIIIGWPKDLKGREPKFNKLILVLQQSLQIRYRNIQCILLDESYSSWEASKISNKKHNDDYAACIILKNWLTIYNGR